MAQSNIKTMKERDLAQVSTQQKIVKIVVQVLLYAFLITMAVMIIFPFYFMLISSVKELAEYKQTIQTLWPNKIVLYNYVQAFNDANLGTLFLNTLYVGVVSTILSLVITVITAFAL